MWICIQIRKRSESTFESTQRRKAKQMQPMWLCILSCRRFEETFENTQWRRAKQMQPMWLCILSDRRFEETIEKNTLGKRQTNATNVNMHPHMQEIGVPDCCSTTLPGSLMSQSYYQWPLDWSNCWSSKNPLEEKAFILLEFVTEYWKSWHLIDLRKNTGNKHSCCLFSIIGAGQITLKIPSKNDNQSVVGIVAEKIGIVHPVYFWP